MKIDFMNLDFYENKNMFERHDHIKTNLVFGNLNSPVPTYTILITTLHRPKLVEEAIISAINQNGFKDYEIVILDIDSDKNNETQKVLKKYQKYKNIFLYQAEATLHGWNRAINLARTKWMTILCDDDLLLPNYLHTIDDILKKHPEIEAIAPKYEFFEGEINQNPLPSIKNKGPKEPIFKRIKKVLRKHKIIPQKKSTYYVGNYLMDHYYLRSAAFAPHGLMYKTENIKKLGGYNDGYSGSLDMILNINYMLNYNMYYTTEILGRKRLGEANASMTKDIQVGFVLLAYSFYKNEVSKSHLKHIKFDDWFIQATVFFMALVEAGLDFSDINEDNLFQEEFYNMESMRRFREKAAEIERQLERLHPPIDCYTNSSISQKLIWKGLN